MTPGLAPSNSRDTSKASNCTSKWVINLSKTPLTPKQLSLLQKAPNFAITPKYPTIEAYITAVEQASSKLPAQEADELIDQTSTGYLNNHRPIAETNVTSTPYNAEP